MAKNPLTELWERELSGMRSHANRSLAVHDLTLDEHDNIVPTAMVDEGPDIDVPDEWIFENNYEADPSSAYRAGAEWGAGWMAAIIGMAQAIREREEDRRHYDEVCSSCGAGVGSRCYRSCPAWGDHDPDWSHDRR